MAIAAGISCDVDPLLYNIMKIQNHCGKYIELTACTECMSQCPLHWLSLDIG